MNRRLKLSLTLCVLALALLPFRGRAGERFPVANAEVLAEAARHKAVVEERMTDFFQYDYLENVNAGRVTSVKASVIETVPVQGWPHRFRSTGKAHVEFYDAGRRTVTRFTRDFEVVTEEKETGAIKIETRQIT